MTPDFQVIGGGINITAKLRKRLLSLVVIDEVGMKSDTVEITLDDAGHAFAVPAPGALLAVAIGWDGALVPMGLYTADEVTFQGPPDKMTIRAKAANLGGSLKEQKTRAWDDKTIEEIVRTIATEHDLTPSVAEPYRSIHYDHLDQTEESDLHFLMRLAKDHDALTSVKGQTLVFMGRGAGQTASGLPMLPQIIRKTGNISWSATLATRHNFKSVEAVWHNTDTGKKEKATLGEGQPVKRLRRSFQKKEEAERAAQAKLDEYTRGNDSFSVTMPGNPLLIAEGQIIAAGFRPGVDGIWSLKSVRHELTPAGFKTKITAEKPKPATN
jgi:phage protein D